MQNQNPVLCDTHCHLTSPDIPGGFDSALERAFSTGVARIVVVESVQELMADTVNKCNSDERLVPACGFHPCFLPDSFDGLALLDEIAPKLKALGEIGLDANSPNMDFQQKFFIEQLRIAKSHNLAVLVHCRRAFELLIDAFEHIGGIEVPVVLHCYSGSDQQARPFVQRGFYFSFAGVLTFTNAKKPINAIRAIPHDRILVETDSPDLTPQPLRGVPNEPANLPLIAAAAARVLNMHYHEFAKLSYENSKRVFGFH